MQSVLLNFTRPTLQLLSCMLMVDQSSMRTPALFHQYLLKAEALAVIAGYAVPSKAEQYSLRCWSASEIWNFACPGSWQIRDSLGAGGAPPVINGKSDSGKVLDFGGVMVFMGVEFRDGVALWVPVPLGLEPPSPVVMLAAAEEDGPSEDDDFVDRVVLGAIEEAEMLKVELLAGEVVATAELPEGVEVPEEDPPTDVVTDKLDPVENSPQLLPAQERP